jgi:hypothetical protein
MQERYRRGFFFRVRPLTPQFFPLDPSVPTGLSTTCRRCEYVRKQYDLEVCPNVVPISRKDKKKIAEQDSQLLDQWEAQAMAEHAGQPGYDEFGRPY